MSIRWDTDHKLLLQPKIQLGPLVVDCCQFGPSWILGWKWSLWRVPAWLAVQLSKDVFFLTLNDSINYMKYFRNCLHHTSAVSQPFLLLVAANLAQDGFLGWKWSLWPVPTWLAVQRSKAVFFLIFYYSINDIKFFLNVLITPQPCHSHFCCWLLPIWPQLDFWAETELMACAGLVGVATE